MLTELFILFSFNGRVGIDGRNQKGKMILEFCYAKLLHTAYMSFRKDDVV